MTVAALARSARHCARWLGPRRSVALWKSCSALPTSRVPGVLRQPQWAATLPYSSASPPPPPPPPPPPVARAVPLAEVADNFLDGSSSVYLEQLLEQWEQNPGSVDDSWRRVFESLRDGKPMSTEAVQHLNTISTQRGRLARAVGVQAEEQLSSTAIQESMRLLLLVRAYQVNGHSIANLDPLGIAEKRYPVELDPALYGFTESDLDKEFFLGSWRMKGFLSENKPVRTLRSILDRLHATYCSSIGFEYMHIPDRERCNWLRERIEDLEQRRYSSAEKVLLLDRLMWGVLFEEFLNTKYTASKRFGLEGGESLIPGLKSFIDRSADLDIQNIVIGMPHRGRLNILANVVRKPMRQIFSEFGQGVRPAMSDDPTNFTGMGDVKYHLGTSYDRPTRAGKRIHLSLMANPSHLEAVNPVVIGKVRAKQHYNRDTNHHHTLPLLLHGDGSFAGQGIVYETLDMAQLPDYTVGGTVHVVVNNQVAFTTDPKFSRSSQYCTDVAKALSAPIFHVNGDDIESVAYVMELAAEWRQRWKEDVVVDLVCYRRYGHNEIDEPSFTQPQMYQKIAKQPNALKIYSDKLVQQGVITPEKVAEMRAWVQGILDAEFEESKTYVPRDQDWLASYWKGFKGPHQLSRIRHTGVPEALLVKVGKAITTLPDWFTPHKGIKRVYEARRKMIETGTGIDWGMAEALAFGTLLVEGNAVRLSGQDVERGTFSHRHALVHDQVTGKRYKPLDHVVEDQAKNFFTVCNSSLSEFGILGFELGYSMENPNALVCWEAQFGDFANGAQVIIDQFLSAGEAKWLRQSGLVMLLPHGYDGQGPEHSSARLERFLQLSDEPEDVIPEMDIAVRKQLQQCNWQIVNCTTPANYFHLLRRQLHRDFRKPLVVMSPKNLLRHPECKSDLGDFDDVMGHPGSDRQGTRFKRLIKDEGNHGDVETGFKRIIFCSGKLYYDLNEKRRTMGLQDKIAIVRIEQLHPFPWDLVERELNRYQGGLCSTVSYSIVQPIVTAGQGGVMQRRPGGVRAQPVPA
eukprot:jgi/Mesvir1/12345/Mv00529-RA.3